MSGQQLIDRVGVAGFGLIEKPLRPGLKRNRRIIRTLR